VITGFHETSCIHTMNASALVQADSATELDRAAKKTSRSLA
jgi:hypothetical protein